jgi:hypothetical protein
MHYVVFNDVKQYKKFGHELVYDRDITVALAVHLQSFKHDTRVVAEGLPEFVGQAIIFASILGEPNRVVHLTCSKDVAQLRVSSATAYAQSALQAKEVASYYSKRLPGSFMWFETNKLTVTLVYEL